MKRVYKTGKENPRYIYRKGERHITKEGYSVVIIEHYNKLDCTIRFEEGLVLKSISYKSIKKGTVKNPYFPTVYGVGYVGVGKYERWSKGKETKEYTKWKGMLRRFRDKKYLQKHITYRETSSDTNWHNFQIFSEWFEQNWKSWMDSSWQLDKDILIKGNKIYSPETCCFVPQEINKLFTKNDKFRGDLPIGVSRTKGGFSANLNGSFKTFNTPEEAFKAYKTTKEAYIKKVADRWRGQITEPTYEAMYRYQVEITD